MQNLLKERLVSALNQVHGTTEPVDPKERRRLLIGAGMLALGGVAIAVLEACNIDPTPIKPELQVGRVERALIAMVEAALNKIVQPGTIFEGQTVVPIISVELPSDTNDPTDTALMLKMEIENSAQTIYIIPDLGGSDIENDGKQLVIRLRAHMWIADGERLVYIENTKLRSRVLAGDGVTKISRLSPKDVFNKDLPTELEGKIFYPSNRQFKQYNFKMDSNWEFNPNLNGWTRAVEFNPGTSLS
ncbi:MAG TPA: hypothetical protein PKJ26_02850 [Candidatus Woesebacteria bacterium]|nr:hypothetical protein [Candidatus Woesebacteria bacterium]HNS65408.1 hypothetical protein [Candidatus Woesebacteria bacterium]